MVDRRRTWRIIFSPYAAGSWNMAVDEAIFESAGSGAVPTTLRLYAWHPACLSLGMAQPFAEADLEALQDRGWHLVRRPTGGRAILHTDELTYSICGPQTEPCLAGGVLESYRVISAALLKALAIIGVEAVADKMPGTGDASRDFFRKTTVKSIEPVCFIEPSNYEITAGGKKLVGSAQARRGMAVLQHGSLPITGDLKRIVQVLNFPAESDRQEAARQVDVRAATLEQVLEKKLSWELAANAMQQAFETTLGLHFLKCELTDHEIRRARELETQKYQNPQWTERI